MEMRRSTIARCTVDDSENPVMPIPAARRRSPGSGALRREGTRAAQTELRRLTCADPQLLARPAQASQATSQELVVLRPMATEFAAPSTIVGRCCQVPLFRLRSL